VALAGEDTVGLRVPDADVVRSIVQALREPVTGTSANRSGGREPRSAQEVAFQLGEMVSLVIDGGPVRSGTASTVIDVTAEGGPKILREGAVAREELEQALGKKIA
jgi:L-threonylcarbamoyladenylate synthase